MVNKRKTIDKLMARYREVYPIPGKKTLYDCFFCLHGQHYIQFRTQDKRLHVEKVCRTESEIMRIRPYDHLWDLIVKFLTQPVRFGVLRG
jgi:hypothetical protein